MRLATQRDGTRDGRLLVVAPDGTRALDAGAVVPTLQAALDEWARCEAPLRRLGERLAEDPRAGEPLDVHRLGPPLPRAYEWVDGSAYLNHVVLVRRARGAEPPATLWTDPLVYQGGSGVLLGPTDDVPLGDPAWGLDFESEVCVVLGDTPRGVPRARAGAHVRLFMLANDLSYRNLIPEELAKGFGFFQSKPATAFSPFAVTPDELGSAWRDGRVHLPLVTRLNGARFGDPDAGVGMHFSFPQLIEHIARTRAFTAGTILGSGTVSNEDPARGASCIAERRVRETLELGGPQTPYLAAGDRVTIEMLDAGGRSLFGRLEQAVVP